MKTKLCWGGQLHCWVFRIFLHVPLHWWLTAACQWSTVSLQQEPQKLILLTQLLPTECTFIVLWLHTDLIPGHLLCSCHHCLAWREVRTPRTRQTPLLCSASSVCVTGSPAYSGMSGTLLWIPCRIYREESKVTRSIPGYYKQADVKASQE